MTPAKDRGYLLITSHASWDRLSDQRRWVFDKPRAIHDELVGEEAVIYLTAHGGPSSLGGLVRFTGPVKPFAPKGGTAGIYTLEAPTEVILNLRSPVDIHSVKERLSFIPKSSHWGAALQGQPVKRIPYPDFQLLRQTVVARGKTEAKRLEAAL